MSHNTFQFKNFDEDTSLRYPASPQTNPLNLEKPTQSNSDYLYSLGEKAHWKTMIDINGYVLPGSSEPYKVCGTFAFMHCVEHHYGRRIVYSCNRMGCPKCVRKAGLRAAKKIERRIWLYRLKTQAESYGKRNPKPSHMIESIPADSNFWSYTRSKQNRILREIRKIVGIEGGAEIMHLWRFRENKTIPYYSPHNHLLVFGWLNLNKEIRDFIFKKYGIDVIYKKRATLHTREDVKGCAYYLFSHCAVKNNKDSIKWFGSLSYRKISNKELKKFRDDKFLKEDLDIEKSNSCKICSERLKPAQINKKFSNWFNFIPPPDEMEEGCIFQKGLLQSIDFSQGEQMTYYDEKYNEVYKKSKYELELEKLKARPDLYSRKIDKNQVSLEAFS